MMTCRSPQSFAGCPQRIADSCAKSVIFIWDAVENSEGHKLECQNFILTGESKTFALLKSLIHGLAQYSLLNLISA